jgi:hypothetical protein
MVLGDGTEVRMGNTYGQGGEWEIRGEVRKWMDVPLQSYVKRLFQVSLLLISSG